MLSLSYSSAQTTVIRECGTPNAGENELKKERHYGNNRYLLKVLKRNGIDLPDNYFEMDENSRNQLRARQNNNMAASSYGSTVYYIPIKIWIHRNNAGNDAISYAAMQALLQRTIVIFKDNRVPIVFYRKCNITYVANSPYYDLEDHEVNNMWNNYKDNNAMNVHFVHTAPNAGEALRPGKSLYINASDDNEITLAHELGHNLGLHHPHNGKCGGDKDNEDCGNCTQEPVSRTMTQPAECFPLGTVKKCEVNGDCLCDTQAEPNLFGRLILNTCQYNGSAGTDNWGVPWNPATNNIMSYAFYFGRDCRTTFTYGQIGVMLDHIPNFANTNIAYSISGPDNLCYQQSYTYSIPALSGVNNYTWTVPRNTSGHWPISGQGTTTMTVSNTFWVPDPYVYITPECDYPTAEKSIKALTGLNISGPAEVPPDEVVFNRFAVEYIPGVSYNWSVPSGWLIGSGQGTYEVLLSAGYNGQSGNVSVSTTSCNGLTGSLWVNVTGGGGGPLSVLNEGFQIYPNPADNQLTLESTNKENIFISITRLLDGKAMYSSSMSGKLRLSLSGYPSGFYILRVQSKNEVKYYRFSKN